MEAARRQVSKGRNPHRRPEAGAEAGREGLTGVLPFLFAVRWGAWAIALVLVAFGDLPHDNTRHEPLLLGLTFAQNLAATLYVPLLRPRVRRAVGPRGGPRDDLIALGLVDMATVLAVLYFSGGWRTPYYHYAVSSLLVPAFLLGWRRAAVLLLGFFAAYLAVISTAGQGTDGPWLREDASSLAGILITPLLVVVVVQYLSQLTRRLSEQRERAEQALAENVRLQGEREELAAQEERSRIAREIHDGIAQSIYMLSLNLEKAAEVAKSDQKLGERLGKLVGLAKETLLEVRHYIFDLKPLLAGDAGLSATIRSQIQEFSTVSSLPVRLQVEGEERKVPLAVGSSLYRIAQEALANVYRHAEASSIDVHLAFSNDSVSLEVRDNGRGFSVDSASTGGRGLRNIRQRVGELGGQVEITSAPGQGASLRVTLPIAE
ncbi:MAG: sensor histidine kinase [Chloroflexota bacterium]|nr:sensor histidine kinase [Chloroflexota bacterium]